MGGTRARASPLVQLARALALADGDRELATFDGKGWGRRPVRVTIGGEASEPGLVLFAAFVVRGLAEDASTAAAAGSTAAVSGGG